MRVGSGTSRQSTSRITVGGVLVLAGLLVVTGCTREFFRERADSDVDRLLAQRAGDERWPLINYWVYPHPLSRFADFDSPDCPTMPPDDPAAWMLSRKPQHPSRVGYHEGTGYLDMLAQFDAITRANDADAAARAGQTAIPLTPPPEITGHKPYLIDLGQALELAVINSREFQAQRENLYLAALPVSLEQFAFLPQFLATEEAIRQWSARESQFGHSDNLQLNTAVGLSQQFATGAALLLRMANQTVIDFSQFDRPTLSQSTLTFDMVQPLLRGGGRAVALEPLTQVERDLLYEIRDFARFNKEFFTLVAGGSITAQLVPGSSSVIFGGSLRAQAATAGYLPVVTQKLNLEVNRRNVDDFQRLLQFYREFAEGGGVSQLQVDQVEQQVLLARTRVLQQQVDFQDNLERFKVVLGLPTDTPIDLDFAEFRPIRQQIFRFRQLEDEYNDFVQRFNKLGAAQAPGDLRRALLDLVGDSALTRGTTFASRFPVRMQRWNELNSSAPETAAVTGAAASLGALAPGGLGLVAWAQIGQAGTSPLRRQQQLRDDLIDQRDDLIDAEQDVPPELEERIRRERYEFELAMVEFLLSTYQAQPWREERNPLLQQAAKEALFRQLESRMALVADEARRERELQYGQEWPKLPPALLGNVNLLATDLEEAYQLVGRTALENRLDLMNQQAQLVDSWRKVAVFANSLLGTFDVRYNATVLTPPPAVAQPLNFDGNQARHQLIFNAELPLVRRLERNNYRASLIAYQRQRRNLQAVQDTILFQVRGRVRRLQQLQETYRIQQRGLLLAYSSLSNALETLRAPPEPGANQDTASRAAALTQQVIQVQSRVAQAQSELYQTWLSFLVARMELYRDLELMQIDSRGVWIDDVRDERTTPPAP